MTRQRPKPPKPGAGGGRPRGRDGDIVGVFRRAAGGYGFVRPEGALPGDRSGDVHVSAAAALDAVSGVIAWGEPGGAGAYIAIR